MHIRCEHTSTSMHLSHITLVMYCFTGYPEISDISDMIIYVIHEGK